MVFVIYFKNPYELFNAPLNVHHTMALLKHPADKVPTSVSTDA